MSAMSQCCISGLPPFSAGSLRRILSAIVSTCCLCSFVIFGLAGAGSDFTYLRDPPFHGMFTVVQTVRKALTRKIAVVKFHVHGRIAFKCGNKLCALELGDIAARFFCQIFKRRIAPVSITGHIGKLTKEV